MMMIIRTECKRPHSNVRGQVCKACRKSDSYTRKSDACVRLCKVGRVIPKLQPRHLWPMYRSTWFVTKLKALSTIENDRGADFDISEVSPRTHARQLLAGRFQVFHGCSTPRSRVSYLEYKELATLWKPAPCTVLAQGHGLFYPRSHVSQCCRPRAFTHAKDALSTFSRTHPLIRTRRASLTAGA